MIEERRQDLPQIGKQLSAEPALAASKNEQKTLLARAADAFTESLSRVCCNAMLCAGSALIGICVFLCSMPHLQTLEPEPFSLLYSSGLGLLFFLMALTASQFVEVWTRLERLLDELEFHPIRVALSALPPDRTWSPIWQNNVRRRNHILLTRGVECLQALVRRKPDLEAQLTHLEEATNAVLKRFGDGQNESAEQMEAARQSNEIANDLAADLECAYWKQGAPDWAGSRRAERARGV